MKPIEALMFALVQRYAPQFVPAPLREQFDTGLAQAQAVLAGDAQLADWGAHKTARIDTWQGVLARPPVAEAILATVSTALYAGQNLGLAYLGENGEKRREVRPLALVERDEVLYLALRFVGYDDTRLLALHRIVGAEALATESDDTGRSFAIDAYIEMGLPFALAGEKTLDLHLRLHASTYRTVKGRPPLRTASISEPVDGWFELTAPGVANTMELRWWLLGFGDKLRIVEPEALVRELQAQHFDALTGLVGRRACQEQLRRLIAAGQRSGQPLAVAMVDIDHFKAINDQLGHGAGDRALQEVAGRLKAACRSMDVVGRWGGEEFLILLPDTTLDAAASLAERLRQAVAATPCRVDDRGASREVTLSIGVSSTQRLPADLLAADDTLEALVRQADAAMYTAKNNARNCVEVFVS